MGLTLAGQILGRRLGETELSYGVFDDCLPYRSGAQVDLVGRITYGIAEGDGKLGIGTDIPKKDVGIEQNPHASNSLRTSSGRDRSKSAGTLNRPAHNPKGRG